MSATCLHPDADAPRHPECPGCAALSGRGMTNGTRTAVEPMSWSVGEIVAAIRNSSATYEHAFRLAAAMVDPIDAALLDALAAGIQRGSMWIEVDNNSGDRNEWRLMTGPQGQATPSAQRRVLVRVWLEQVADRIDVCSLSPGPELPSFLPDRPLTPEERAASDDEPCPGVWAGESGADLRKLSQFETDVLIRSEIVDLAMASEVAEVTAVVGGARQMTSGQLHGASVQRGGIDSDPFVRLLAYRAWGDRDRQWFELRGVRKGEALTVTRVHRDESSAEMVVALAWSSDRFCGNALEDGLPGSVVKISTSTAYSVEARVSDRLREEPQRWSEPDLNVDMFPIGRHDDRVDTLTYGMTAAVLPLALRPTVYPAMVSAEVAADVIAPPFATDSTVSVGGTVTLSRKPSAPHPSVTKPEPHVPPWARDRRR